MYTVSAVSGVRIPISPPFAGVMELADVVDSKSTGSDTVPVRVRPPAPESTCSLFAGAFLSFISKWNKFIAVIL